MAIDYLRDYPFEVAPDTWGLNDTFLNIIREKESLWASHGLTWTMGVEREVKLLSPNEFDDFIKKSYPTNSESELIKIDSQLANSFNARRNLMPYDSYRNRYSEVEMLVSEEIRKRVFHARTPLEIERVRQEEKEFNRIKETWGYSEKSRRDLVLSYLHIFPEAQGGMADLIEYRFGQAGHGRGWYDGKSIVEFRTPPIDGMINAIEKYNKILWGIKTASQRFGLIPQGYFELLEKSPALITNDLPDELVRNTQLKALPSRASSLRICEDTMEVRMDISHLARNMALLIAGCSVYAFGKDNLIESKENDGLSMADYIVIPDALKARFTSISSTLESCRLDEDGYLVPDESTVSWNMKGMNVEAGVTPKDVTAPSVDGHGQYTLADWEGWYLSLKKLKYKDGQVEVSELPKELQPIFSKLNGLSTVRRPYFRKLNNETNILADKLDDQADQAILKRAFGEAHGSSVIGFYKQADSDNRIRKAGAVVNSVLMDADDLDKPNSDIAEKIYDVLFKSIADCLDKTNGKSGIPDIRTLHTLTQRRLSDLSLEAELTAASGITSNAQIDALGDDRNIYDGRSCLHINECR